MFAPPTNIEWFMRKIFRYTQLFVFSLMVLLAGCDSGANDVESSIVEGVDLDEVFAPAQASEIQAVLNDWSQRDVSAQGVIEVASDTVTFTNGSQSVYRIVSHQVGGNTHYGAIVVPAGATPGSLPVVVYNHGGDEGENLDATLGLLAFGVNEIVDQFVFVVPAYRSESLTLDGQTYQSGGTESPLDYDVDDAISLLNVALETTSAIDPTRIATLGFSRGGGVALLMSIRDPRVELVSEFFGPTDFFVADIRDSFREALLGDPRDLPGSTYLDDNYIQPLRRGEITVAEARAELVRRSAVLFAEQLPKVQILHGDADEVVDVAHAQSLAEVLQDMGRGDDELSFMIFPGAGHNPLEMLGSFDLLVDFMAQLTPGAA